MSIQPVSVCFSSSFCLPVLSSSRLGLQKGEFHTHAHTWDQRACLDLFSLSILLPTPQLSLCSIACLLDRGPSPHFKQAPIYLGLSIPSLPKLAPLILNTTSSKQFTFEMQMKQKETEKLAKPQHFCSSRVCLLSVFRSHSENWLSLLCLSWS